MLLRSENMFDATISINAMEEVDADKMMAELVRVTEPGCRVGVPVRSIDLQYSINLDAPAAVRAGGERAGGVIDLRGCAHSSLSRRFNAPGVHDLKMYPNRVRMPSAPGMFKTVLRTKLSGQDSQLALAAGEASVADGSFFYAMPYRCDVSIKPK